MIGAAASSTSLNSASTMNASGCTGPPTNTGSVAPGKALERRHRVDGGDVRRPAEHEPHRALFVVVRDQDDGLAEVRIVQGRRRDEQLPLE